MQDTAELIPHRGRWHIATRVVSIDGPSIVCEGDFDEAYVEGHFPGQPVVPGVALLEGLAQTMLALSHLLDPDLEGTPFLAGFDKVRFRAPVFPPATVRFSVKLVEQRAGLTQASGTATWNGTRVCTARLTGAVIPAAMKKAVVIGSGMGGLTSAILLQQEGFEVTVLEQHTRPGGMLHRFFREGVAYDTGFHYCGSIEAGQPLGQILRHLGVFDELEFHALDADGFDHLVFPDFRFAVPFGWEAYEARLHETFPHEAAGISSFLAELKRARDPYGLYRMEPTLDIEQLVEVESRPLLSAIADHVRDPRVASVLCGQAVLYGVPPEDASFGVHALILDHFLRGAYSIKGGGDKLAMSLTRRIRRNGGRVLMKTAATSVEVDDMKAVAVHAANGERYEADVVVSNLHPRLTLELLPEVATRKAYRTRVNDSQVGHGHFGVYLEVDGRVPELGNHNVYRHTSWDPTYAYRAVEPHGVGLYFASSPTEHLAEPPEKGVVLMLAPLAWETVAPYASAYGERPEAYQVLKQQLLDSAVRALVADHPSLEGRIVRAEASTPLSTEHFTRTPNGATYGHLHSTGQMGRYRPSQRTRVRNLVLAGQGVFSPGILGVSLSAYYAVGHLLGLETLLEGLRRA